MSTASTANAEGGSANIGFVVMIATAAALGGFLFGFDTSVINGAVQALQGEFGATPLQVGLAVSLALLGSAVGAFIAGPLADRLGRTRSMTIAGLLFMISAVGSGLPFGLVDFIAWRFVGGMAVGAASVLAPAYIAEVSPADMRGRLGSLQQLAIVTGIFIALYVGYGISVAAGGAESEAWFGYEGWRWMFWSEIPAAILYTVASLFIPESPRYLVSKGRDEEAAAVLSRVIGGDATRKVDEIRASMDVEHKPSFSDLRGRMGLLPIVWIGVLLSIFQQFVGINVVFYYSSAIWQAVGFSEQDAMMTSTITGLVNIITTLIAISLVDKLGRKPLLIIGSIGMAITLGMLTYVFGGADTVTVVKEGVERAVPQLTSGEGKIAIIAFNLYVFCFGMSWGPVVWVLLGEMFNNKIRAAALAFAASAQWVANFLVSTTFPPIAVNLGLGVAYGIYTLFATLSIFFVWKYVKETKGRELEEM